MTRFFEVLVAALQLVVGLIVAELFFHHAWRRKDERVAFTR